ncbi:TraC family protein [Rhizobium sp. Root1203]|uniref:TraC family protein n=1 Tax=Rhizobium sp. Root1203 TaxID=1736427 RepID=UPI0009E6EF04|nr:TraC family protein [Rhizobium sp. Root1203]
MKKPSSKIRDEIAKLQERLKVAETKEAERLGEAGLRFEKRALLPGAMIELARRLRGTTALRLAAGSSPKDETRQGW